MGRLPNEKGHDNTSICVIFFNQLALSGRIPVPAIAVSESSFTQPNSAVSQSINSQMWSPLYSNLRAKYHWTTQLLAIQFNFIYFRLGLSLLDWGHVTTCGSSTRSNPIWSNAHVVPNRSCGRLITQYLSGSKQAEVLRQIVRMGRGHQRSKWRQGPITSSSYGGKKLIKRSKTVPQRIFLFSL